MSGGLFRTEIRCRGCKRLVDDGPVCTFNFPRWCLNRRAGVVKTIQAFAPLLQQSEQPSIIATTASIGGLVVGPHFLADYCASKHAVVSLTESLAQELYRTGYEQIRVHVVSRNPP